MTHISGTAMVGTVFDAMNVAYAVLGGIVAIGFFRILLPQSRAQLPGTILVVVLGAVAYLLMSAVPSAS